MTSVGSRPTTRLVVNEKPVEVAAGATVLDAARAAGVAVPTLCWDPRLPPQGSCRVCLVAVAQPDGAEEVVAACTAPAVEGSTVDTSDARVRTVVRDVLGLLVSDLPARALRVSPDRSELVQVCREFGVTAAEFTGARPSYGTDHTHPYVKLDRDLCIACNRCVSMCADVQGTFALTLAGRGHRTMVDAGDGGDWVDSPCVACGGCVDTCPTGALSEPGLLDPRPVTGTVTTTCGYCGVGCALDVHIRDDEVAAITPVLTGPVNRGHACGKGRFAHAFVRSPDRLTRPLIRRGGRDSPLSEATWEEAIGLVADRLRAARDTGGIAMISSARATNEENYLAQKIARTILRTNNIDNCSRLCHSPSAAGLTRTFGLAGGTNPLDDLDHADCILLAGANPTDAHPVVGARIKQRVLAGARLIVVDPRRIELAWFADVHLAARPGSNVAVFHGLARLLLEGGHVDADYLRRRVTGLGELRDLLRDYPADRAAAMAGVPAEALRDAARLFGEAEHPAIVYGLGVTEHTHGTDGVRTLANLALLRGAVGTPGCCGVMPLRGQNNVQGASDMGALPDLLPGYQPVTDATVQAKFADVWSVAPPPVPGLRIPDMFDAALSGRLRVLYVIGEDIAQTDPNTGRVQAALAATDFVVCHEIFPSRTTEHADVVLPAASFLEKDGTFVNFDRRFQRVRPALPPPGDAKTDFDILLLLARALDADPGFATPAEAMAECATTSSLFTGISHARLDAAGPLHWPCPDPTAPGHGVLYRDGFATPDGRAALSAAPYLPPGEVPDDDFPFVLVTGRRREHYNAGTMTRRTPNLTLRPAEALDIHPADAARLGVVTGDQVEVASRHGAVAVPVHLTPEMSPGQVFLAFHFPDAAANALTSSNTDRATGCPEYKVTAVRVRPAAGH